MIYPDVSIEEWCDRHPGLKVVRSSCVVCGRGRIANIPFIEKDWAGFIAKPCQCGMSGDSFSTQYPRTGKYQELCNQLLASKSAPNPILGAECNKSSMEKPVSNCRLKVLK